MVIKALNESVLGTNCQKCVKMKNKILVNQQLLLEKGVYLARKKS